MIHLFHLIHLSEEKPMKILNLIYNFIYIKLNFIYRSIKSI